MVYMKNENDFSEREITAFKQLFGIEQNTIDFQSVLSDALHKRTSEKNRRETFREGDSIHNDAILASMMPRRNEKNNMVMKSVDILPRMSDESNPELDEQKSFTASKKKSPSKLKK